MTPYHALKICLYQTLSLHLLQCLCQNVIFLSHTQSCVCRYSISLPYFHTWATFSISETYTLASSLGLILLVQGILACSSWSQFFLSLDTHLKLWFHQTLDIFLSNKFRNILRLFDVLPNFPFTTSETMDDCYLQTWYLRVAERLKTEDLRTLGNISKVPKFHRMIASKFHRMIA